MSQRQQNKQNLKVGGSLAGISGIICKKIDYERCKMISICRMLNFFHYILVFFTGKDKLNSNFSQTIIYGRQSPKQQPVWFHTCIIKLSCIEFLLSNPILFCIPSIWACGLDTDISYIINYCSVSLLDDKAEENSFCWKIKKFLCLKVKLPSSQLIMRNTIGSRLKWLYRAMY